MGSEWQSLSLRDAGIQLIDCDHRTPPSAESGYPYIAIPQLKDGRIELGGVRRISKSDFEDWTRKLKPREHDVIVVRRCSSGYSAVVPRGLDCAIGQNLIVLRSDGRRVIPEFLRWIVRGDEWWEQIRKFMNVGAVFNSLKCKDIPNFEVIIPPLDAQREITNLLTGLDDKITLLRVTNATLEAIAQALFKSWFVDFDPVRAKAEGRDPEGVPPEVADLFPSEFEDSDMGAIPKGWRVGTLGGIAQVIDCLHAKKPVRTQSGPTLLQLGNILDSGLMDLSDRFCISKEDYDKWTSRMEVIPGDCVITNVGRVGAVAQMPAGEQAAMGRNMTGLRHRIQFPYPTFLVECLQSGAMRLEMKRKTDMGTILDALNVRSIPNLRFCLPDSSVAKAFEDIARPARARMELNLKEILSLATMRDTLLPRLMSGKLRIEEVSAW